MSNYYHLKITVWANVSEPRVFVEALPRLFSNSRASDVSLGHDGEWVIRVMDFDTTEGSASALCGVIARSLAGRKILAQVHVDLWDAENPDHTHHTPGYHTYHAAARRAAAIDRERMREAMEKDLEAQDHDDN